MRQSAAMLAPADVQRQLGISYSTVHRWIKDGRLRAIRLPTGQTRILREDVEAIRREKVMPVGATT